jgi:hypothetical protein
MEREGCGGRKGSVGAGFGKKKKKSVRTLKFENLAGDSKVRIGT